MGHQLEIPRGGCVAQFGADFAGTACADHMKLVRQPSPWTNHRRAFELSHQASQNQGSEWFAYTGGAWVGHPTDKFPAWIWEPRPEIITERASSPPDAAAAVDGWQRRPPRGIVHSLLREAKGSQLTEPAAQAVP